MRLAAIGVGLAIAAAVQTANMTYLVIYAVLGLIGLVTAGYGLNKWNRKQAVREAKLDGLIDPETGVMARLAAIEKNLSPNGKDTQGVGDIAARIEDLAKKTNRGVAALRSRLDQHIGECKNEHAHLREELDRKQDKEAS